MQRRSRTRTRTAQPTRSTSRRSRRTLTTLTVCAVTLGAVLVAGAPGFSTPAAEAAADAPALITTRAQTIDGFGASGAWWVNDLDGFSSSTKSTVADALFSAGGLNLSIYRYNIGGGGTGVTTPARAPQTLRTGAGSYDWTRDPGGSYFLRAAAGRGVPTLIGFVNSAPKDWTTNAKSCGGSLTSGSESAYATYLADVSAHWAAEGVALDQLSPMNEPDDPFAACAQEGMTVPVGQRAAVIRTLGQTLAARSLPIGISADETSRTSDFVANTGTWLGEASAAGYVTQLSHHTYDFPDDAALRRVAAIGANAGKPLWASEICCQKSGTGGYGQQYDPTMNGGLDLSNYIFRDFTLANDQSFQWWTALSAEVGCDVAASSSCATSVNTSGWNDGLIYYDRNRASNGNESLYFTKRFYVLGQFSRYVRPGAVRYEVSGVPQGVQATAYWQGGAWTVVAANTNNATTTLNLDTNSATLTPTGTNRTSASENLAAVDNPTVSGSVLTGSLTPRSVTTFRLNSSGQPGSGGRSSVSTLIGAGSTKCLDVPGFSTADGVQPTIYTCNGGANQNWTLTAAGEVRGYGDRCLDAAGQGTTAGTKVVMSTCGGGLNQKWTLVNGATLVGRQSGLCLDVSGAATADGSPVLLWTCGTAANQRWTRG